MPKIFKQNIRKIGYKLDETDFNNLELILKEVNDTNTSNTISYSIREKNNEISNGLDLSQLLKQPNIGESAIERITVYSNYLGDDSITIEFTVYGKNPIVYNLSFLNKNNLRDYEEQLDNYIESIKTDYSFISVSPLLKTLLTIFISFIITRIIISIFILLGAPSFVTEYPFNINIYSVLMTFFGLFIVRFMNKIYPIADFSIGIGKKVSEQIKNYRKLAYSVFILPILPIIIEKFI